MTQDRQAQGRQNRLLGQWGEAAVAEDLRKKGWVIEAAGFRCRMGEIDLVATKGKFLAFVEVKLRKDDRFATAAEAVTRQKQDRLRAAAEIYLMRYPTELQPRFDVAEVYAPQGTATPKPDIRYIENAF